MTDVEGAGVHDADASAPSSHGEPWSHGELEAAVEAYDEMLDLERRRTPYVKSEVRRRVLAGPLQGRSKRSFEERMGNISAIRQELGLEIIAGYKPKPHVGVVRAAELREIIESRGGVHPGRRSSVQSLQTLYAAAMALALGVAVERLVSGTGDELIIEWASLPVLIAFVVTIIPFFHGAMCHLDSTYHGGSGQLRGGALLSDFVILFVQGVIFFVFARAVLDTRAATGTLVVLLALDVVWGFGTSLIFRREPRWTLAPMKWAVVNLVVLPLLLILLFVQDDHEAISWAAFLLMGIAIIRTVADYAVSWRDLYFPEPTCESPYRRVGALR